MDGCMHRTYILGITFDSLVQGDATAVLPIDGCTNWAEVVGSNPGASNCAGLSFLCCYILLKKA